MASHFFGITDRTFSYSHTVGRSEFAGTGFRNPVDMAISSDDTVYVVNRSYDNRPDGMRVTMVSMNEEYITEFGTYGEGDGQFVWPTSITLDDQGNVYVADEWLNRISIFNKDGEYLRSWGQAGTGDGELDWPAGLAINGDSIYVSDSRSHRVQRFSLDGTFQRKFGSFGTGPGQFNMPWGIGLDKDDNVYVTDWRNDRVQQFSADGTWQASFGNSGSGSGQFNRPNAVCVDADGDIYVADWLNDRVQVLSPEGRYIAEFKGDNQLSQWGKDKLLSNPDHIRQRSLAYSNDAHFEQKLELPCSVKISQQGLIAVLDHTRGRIQVYQKSKVPLLV